MLGPGREWKRIGCRASKMLSLEMEGSRKQLEHRKEFP